MPALSPVLSTSELLCCHSHPVPTGQLGSDQTQHWISPVVPAGAAAALMSCLLSLVRASAHVQLFVQQSGYKMLQIVAPSTELRPQPLISALQNMSLGRGCYEVARLYQK